MKDCAMSGLGHIEAVLFDLDGTLIDTAPDFVRIIKELCVEANVEPLADDEIRVQVSEGSKAMVRLFHPELSDDSSELTGYRNEFLKRYAANIAVDTTLFAGMDAVLLDLETRQIPWGIVTNKPRSLSVALLDAMDLNRRCAVLVCPDDVKNTKPDPEPMFLAAKLIGVEPAQIIYVGDHPRDIDAGRAAGMKTVLAAYGYLTPELAADLASWQADFIIQHPLELLTLLKG
jgi:2-phosphoglycolate phosphatase